MSKLLPGDDFSAYVALRDAGASLDDVAARMKRDGLDAVTRIRALRFVFDVSLEVAKGALVGATALAQQQAAAAQALERLEDDDRRS
jgi:hypothetical protein